MAKRMVALYDVGRFDIAERINGLIGDILEVDGQPVQRVTDISDWWPRPLSMLDLDCDLDIAVLVVTEDAEES